MVPWFKQTQTKMVKLITCQPPTVLLDNGSMVHNQTNSNGNNNDHLMCRPPYTVLLEDGSMVHNKQTQTETVMTISHGDPSVLLENGSMIHNYNQMNADRNRSYQ